MNASDLNLSGNRPKRRVASADAGRKITTLTAQETEAFVKTEKGLGSSVSSETHGPGMDAGDWGDGVEPGTVKEEAGHRHVVLSDDDEDSEGDSMPAETLPPQTPNAPITLPLAQAASAWYASRGREQAAAAAVPAASGESADAPLWVEDRTAAPECPAVASSVRRWLQSDAAPPSSGRRRRSSSSGSSSSAGAAPSKVSWAWIQLPSNLPVPADPVKAESASASASADGAAGEDSSAAEEPPRALAGATMSIPPSIRSGSIGKMRVHRSGRVTMEIGGVLFDVGDADEPDTAVERDDHYHAAAGEGEGGAASGGAAAVKAEAAAVQAEAARKRGACSFHQQAIGIRLDPGVTKRRPEEGSDEHQAAAIAAAVVSGNALPTDDAEIGGELRIYGDVDNTFVVTPDINAALAALAVQRVGQPL